MKKLFPSIYITDPNKVSSYRDWCDASFGFGNYYSYWENRNGMFVFIFWKPEDMTAFKLRFGL